MIHLQQDNPNEALQQFSKSIEINLHNKNFSAVGNTFGLIGDLYNESGQALPCVRAYRNSIKFLGEADKNQLSETFYNLGSAFDSELKYKDAIKVWGKAILITRKLNGTKNEKLKIIKDDVKIVERDIAEKNYRSEDLIFREPFL